MPARWRERIGALARRVLARPRGAFARSRFAAWLARAGLWPLAPRGLRGLGITLAFVAAFGLVAAVLAIQATSTPDFCRSCHIMKPYYQTWKHSAHAGIACVECHISPGVGAELRKKVEALNMVVKYFTQTWGTNPWAEVDDAACLRCHEERLLEGRAAFGAASFDHRPHLGEPLPGLKLRCTSCHAQPTKAQHIAIETSPCALCHLRDAPANAGLGRCTTCHEIPDRLVTTSAGTKFDHRIVARNGLDCALCHARVTTGTGEVPQERCLNCHNDPAALARYGDTEALHRAHTITHKVDCITCHLEVRHGRAASESFARSGHLSRGDCATCHGNGHSPQQDLYAGLGGRGLPAMPDPMYVAGVGCGGCHNAQVAPGGGEHAHGATTFTANGVACLSCHGSGYDRVLGTWTSGLGERVSALQRQVSATAAAMPAPAPAAWSDAVHNLDLVVEGRGAHNVNFAYALLEKAREQIASARASRGLAPLPAPWSEPPPGARDCVRCHHGIEQQQGAWQGRTFAHGPHVVRGGLACEACHRPHGERPPGETVRFGETGCLSCHHDAPFRNADQCQACHAGATERPVPSLLGTFSHHAHRLMGLQCQECHTMRGGDPRAERATCRTCHERA